MPYERALIDADAVPILGGVSPSPRNPSMANQHGSTQYHTISPLPIGHSLGTVPVTFLTTNQWQCVNTMW